MSFVCQSLVATCLYTGPHAQSPAHYRATRTVASSLQGDTHSLYRTNRLPIAHYNTMLHSLIQGHIAHYRTKRLPIAHYRTMLYSLLQGHIAHYRTNRLPIAHYRTMLHSLLQGHIAHYYNTIMHFIETRLQKLQLTQ